MSTMSMLLESNQACQNQLMTTNYHVNMMLYGKRGYQRKTAYQIISIYHDADGMLAEGIYWSELP